ncbi:hypothetical protein LAV73_09205 [Lysinibacillus xylanilyticus]|uniref:hypothetical protein n=1 Tax=Lysinibacillus xylanilyticus TaxID=582475 RepID=UPI002B24C529|nr:hypothetical protein [Lysinibacillus xylanilyticus]MEB2280173.1 hypothetical protein [Lysinibacillus xylanilyticus]
MSKQAEKKFKKAKRLLGELSNLKDDFSPRMYRYENELQWVLTIPNDDDKIAELKYIRDSIHGFIARLSECIQTTNNFLNQEIRLASMKAMEKAWEKDKSKITKLVKEIKKIRDRSAHSDEYRFELKIFDEVDDVTYLLDSLYKNLKDFVEEKGLNISDHMIKMEASNQDRVIMNELIKFIKASSNSTKSKKKKCLKHG